MDARIRQTLIALTDANGGNEPLALYVPRRIYDGPEVDIAGTKIISTELAPHVAWEMPLGGIPIARWVHAGDSGPKENYKGGTADLHRRIAEALDLLR